MFNLLSRKFFQRFFCLILFNGHIRTQSTTLNYEPNRFHQIHCDNDTILFLFAISRALECGL